jgi:DNA-binding HxlR family transcriptional regulator
MVARTKKTPVPGAPVRGSRSGRPVMALLDLLGRRWTLRVLWELRAEPATFRDLRERCGGLSPTVLNARLQELREAGVLEQSDEVGYRTTASGKALLEALAPLDAWAKAWARRQGGSKKPDQVS